MANIARQYKIRSCSIDGQFLFGNIEAFNVPDLELLLTDPNVNTPDLDVSLEIRGDRDEILNALRRPLGNRLLELEIGADAENDYGKNVYAKWKCVGTIDGRAREDMLRGTISIDLDVYVYEHIIDNEEKYYIDNRPEYQIRRVDGVDQLEEMRKMLGI